MVIKTPGPPADPGKSVWTVRIYRNRRQDDPNRHFLIFPWASPGEVPDTSVGYFTPTEEEKAKIQWFVDRFDGEREGQWVKDLVELAKVVLEEVN
jgi:hypothetical protein